MLHFRIGSLLLTGISHVIARDLNALKTNNSDGGVRTLEKLLE